MDLLSTPHLPQQFMGDAKVSSTDSQELQKIPVLYDTRSAHRSGGRTCWSETQDASAGAGCENQRKKKVKRKKSYKILQGRYHQHKEKNRDTKQPHCSW